MPNTSIAVRYNSEVQPGLLQSSLFDVDGSLSGWHNGNVTLSDDKRTILFIPALPFTPGENVSVTFAGGAIGINGADFGRFESTFDITPKPVAVVLPPGSPTQSGGNKVASLAS
ncbi:MAG TPA: hypothetical protein VGK87_05520, partial [Anaerolineae bacterium]